MYVGIDSRHILGQKDGVGYYTYHLIENLIKLNTDDKFLLLLPQRFPYKDWLNRSFQESLIKFPRSNKLFRFFWSQALLPLESKIRRIDLLHTLADISPFAFGGKKLLTVQDISFLILPQTIPRSQYFYSLRFLPYAARKADRIITPSQCTKQDLLERLSLPEEKIRVIHHAVDSLFRPLEKKTSLKKIKEKYGIERRFLFCLSSLVRRKNLERLIRAHHHLREQGKIDHILIISGRKGWGFFKEIFKVVDELKAKKEVIFTGYLTEEDRILFYNGADLFIYPTLYEGFGLPILEAMGCGTPVITSNTSALPEIAGDAALFIDPYRVDDIASRIQQLLEDTGLYDELRNKGLERVKAFSWEKTARQTLEVYQEIQAEG